MTSPADVRRALSGEVREQHLHLYLETLRATDSWMVFSPFASEQGWVMQLFHHPSGTSIYAHAAPTDSTIWRLWAE